MGVIVSPLEVQLTNKPSGPSHKQDKKGPPKLIVDFWYNIGMIHLQETIPLSVDPRLTHTQLPQLGEK